MNVILISALGEYPEFKGGIAQYASSIAESLEFLSHTAKTKTEVVVLTQKKFNTNSKKIITFRLSRFLYLQKVFGCIYYLYIAIIYRPRHIILTHQLDMSIYQFIHTLFRSFGIQTSFSVCLYGTEIVDIVENSGLINRKRFENLCNNSEQIVVISEYVKEIFISHFPKVNHNRLKLLYPCISRKFIEQTSSQSETKSTLKKYNLFSGKYFVSIGRLVKRKGHAQMIHALEKLDPDFNLYTYVIIGEGSERKNLEKIIREKGLGDRVVLTGEISEKEKYILLSQSVLYIHPSLQSRSKGHRIEGFGISIVEAMSLGIPVIATESGGISEIITHSQNGFICEKESTYGSYIAKAIHLIMSDPTLYKRISKEAKLRSKNFTFTTFVSTSHYIFKKYFNPRLSYICEWFYPVIGGAGIQAERIAEQLSNEFDIRILTKMNNQSPRIELLSHVIIERVGPALQSVQKFNTLYKIYDYIYGIVLFERLLSSPKDSIIHIHGSLENNFSTSSIIYGLIFSKPIIGKVAVHGELSMHEETASTGFKQLLKLCNPFNQLRRALALHLTKYISISSAIIEELRTVGIHDSKIVDIPNGIDTDKFVPATVPQKKHARSMLKIPDDSFVCIVVSRLVSHKGIINPLLITWLDTFKILRSPLLIIAGSGEGLPNSIEHEVRTFINENPELPVRLVGKTHKLIDYYHSADCYISPSQNEGLSNALLEAGSCGLICIATDVSGSRDILQENGILISTESNLLTTQLAQAIQKAHTLSSQKRETLSHTLRASIQHKYSFTKITKKLRQLYISLA